MQRPGQGVVLGHPNHLLCALLGALVGRLLAPSGAPRRLGSPYGSASSCNQVDPAVFFWSWRSPPWQRWRGALPGIPPGVDLKRQPQDRRWSRLSPTSNAPSAESRRRCRGARLPRTSPARDQHAVHSWWGKDSVNLRPGHQRAGPDGASNAGLLWHERHGRAGEPKFGAPIASHLSNTPLRANAANGVTGYDQATLQREWAVKALKMKSNRDHAPCRPHPLGTSHHLLGT